MFWWAWRGIAHYWMRGSLADRVTIFPVLWALVVALTIGDHLTWFGFAVRGVLAWWLTGLPAWISGRGKRPRRTAPSSTAPDVGRLAAAPELLRLSR